MQFAITLNKQNYAHCNWSHFRIDFWEAKILIFESQVTYPKIYNF